jgi:aldehyde dehydrogenase (NAD+)
MTHHGRFYIDGAWVEPHGTGVGQVFDPATEAAFASVALGDGVDVDRAVAAARAAFPRFAATTVAARRALLVRIRDGILARLDEIALALHREMGAPLDFARDWQAQSGADHFTTMIKVLDRFAFEERQGETLVLREPVGVCGMITPWNWPLNQIACKVAPALAAGCTMVLKPSEQAPLDALILAEIIHDAGVPAGVFNLVNGDGPGVGAAIAGHPGIDMVSFTGSTRAGIEVARLAAPSVKRVAQELGGNCPNILLDDVDLAAAVTSGVQACLSNAGQSCNSPQRMLVPMARMDEAAVIAREAAEAERPGPVASARHFAKVQALIALGIENGARLVTGGVGRPDGVALGWHVRPTVFADVTMQMPIARTEVFGPVLQLIGYRDEDEAVAIANDTEYGLAAYVQSASRARALAVARRLRAGWVEINHAPFDYAAPFGGYRQSGNGREYGVFGLLEYLEVKAVMGA